MAFVSPPLSIPTSLGTHTGFGERPSSGAAAWGEPDPLAQEHDELLRNVLANQGITQTDVEAGDAAVGVCLDAASKAHTTLEEVTAFLTLLPQTSLSAASIAAIAAGGGGGSGGGAADTSQADISAAAAAAAAAAQTNRKRPLSAGIASNLDALHDNSTTHNRIIATSGGSGASSLATLAESSLEAAAAAAAANNKGLKHFSLKVCEKVEEKGFTNYNEVADELVQDMLADAANGINAEGSQGNGGASGSGTGPHDDKNIRRRVYDALNVLEALGIIAKSKRDIEWRGWPPALRRTTTEKDRLEAERARLAARIKLKADATEDVTVKAFCLSNLVLRNRDAPLSALMAAQELGIPAPNPLALPFMLVHAPENAEVDIDITPDERTARLDFHHYPFQIFDDERVMQMMGLGEPQPELAAAIFGSGGGVSGGKDGADGNVDEEQLIVGGAAAPATAHAFLAMPEFDMNQVKQEEQHQIKQHQVHQQQQEQAMDLADTPLKVAGNNTSNNDAFNSSGLVGGSGAGAAGAGGISGGGIRLPDGSIAVLSPSAAVSAMDLGPDDTRRK